MKKHFRRKRAQLKGARKLRSDGKPFFVHNTCSGLTEVNLELKQSDFPKVLVGSHAAITEVLLRQILLQGFHKICPSIMQSIGNGKTFKYPLPQTWIKHIADNGVTASFISSRILLLLLSMKRTIYGFAKFCILLFRSMNTANPGCPYVVFTDLQPNNLPTSQNDKSYDIISWYNESKIKKANIRKIWAQAKIRENYIPPKFLIVSQTIFPGLNYLNSYLLYISKCMIAFVIAVLGILRGKWWYGFLYPEAINLHYANALKRDFLAEDYYFNNSNWYYKPLWAYEAEGRGSSVSLYYYSTNMENMQYNNYKKKETFGLKIMSWNRFIVWDQQQEDFLKQYCPNAVYIKIGSLDFTGIEYKNISSNRKKIISVFDVTPTRPIFYTMLGYAIPPYYSEELNLKFLSTIINVFNDDDWEILWKRKRVVSNAFVSNGFKRKQDKIAVNSVITIDPAVSARSLIQISDAVISMPFASTSLLAKEFGVPSIYYDASGKIQKNRSHDISVLKIKNELSQWKSTLNKKQLFHLIN